MRGVWARCLLAIVALCLASCGEADAVPENPTHVEARRILSDYIRIDTSNPPGNETAGATFLKALIEAEGIETHLVGSDPARQTIWARLDSGKDEPALLLLHHIDVVPADPAEWKIPPFSGEEVNGYIWGRGALDIKSLGVAHLMAFLDLKRQGRPLSRDVIFMAIVDEEAGGTEGIVDLLESNPEIFENVGFVLNEGGSNQTVVDHVRFWGVEVDQKVPLWLRLTAKGAAGHAAAPPPDGGASKKLVDALASLQQVPLETRLIPSVERYFHSIAPTRPGEVGRTLARIEDLIGSPREIDHLPDAYRILLGDTLAITRIQAGQSTNSIPASASGDVDIRLLPGSDPEETLAHIRAIVPADVEIEVLLSGPPSPAAPVDSELFRILEEEMLASEPGSKVGPMVLAGTTDSRFFRNRGVIAYGVSPFKVNYYDAAGVHGFNEKIRTNFFVQGVDLVRSVVRRFCLTDPS